MTIRTVQKGTKNTNIFSLPGYSTSTTKWTWLEKKIKLAGLTTADGQTSLMNMDGMTQLMLECV